MSKEFVDFSKWNLEEQASQFQSAVPFNFIFIDDFLNQNILKEVLDDFNNQDFSTWDKRNHDKIQIKWRSDWKDDNDVPDNTYKLIQYFNSGNFLRYLSKITGIQGIIPDPYLTGGGFNQINRGGTLAVHADGNWHDLMGVHRRLNVILYLNEDWQDEWGGHLELWSKTKDNNPNRCEEKINPLLNRLVIFRTDDFSFHGHPTPLKCPDDRSRRSLILYYYTNTRPLDEVVDINLKHRALFHNPEDIGVKYDI